MEDEGNISRGDIEELLVEQGTYFATSIEQLQVYEDVLPESFKVAENIISQRPINPKRVENVLGNLRAAHAAYLRAYSSAVTVRVLNGLILGIDGHNPAESVDEQNELLNSIVPGFSNLEGQLVERMQRIGLPLGVIELYERRQKY